MDKHCIESRQRRLAKVRPADLDVAESPKHTEISTEPVRFAEPAMPALPSRYVQPHMVRPSWLDAPPTLGGSRAHSGHWRFAMKNAKASTPAKTALNANSSPVSAPKRRAGRVAIDTKDATRPSVVGNAATPKGKNKGKDNPLVGKDAARAAKPDASKTPRTVRAKLSALDAAALVLADLSKSEAATGIGANDLIDRMQSNGLWQSPGGKTPSATLYAAMVREISAKGDASRFARIAKGRFALAAGIMKPAKSGVAKAVRNAAPKGDAMTPAQPEPKPSSVKPTSGKPASKAGAKA